MSMENNFNLTRFLDAQNQVYLNALSEIRNGQKETHWMWFIFPQLKGLGRSSTADYYGIAGIREAEAYLQHPVLGKHLVEITRTLLDVQGRTAFEIFGSPDDLKLRSSMTLFSNVQGADPIFQKAIEHYFEGKYDNRTLSLLD